MAWDYLTIDSLYLCVCQNHGALNPVTLYKYEIYIESLLYACKQTKSWRLIIQWKIPRSKQCGVVHIVVFLDY